MVSGQRVMQTEESIYHTNTIDSYWQRTCNWWKSCMRCKPCSMKYKKIIFLNTNGTKTQCPKCGKIKEVKK